MTDIAILGDETTPLLEFRNVEKRFGGSIVAVKDLNLKIGRGDFVAIMGPSGCGKTTTLRMLAGLEEPTSGTLLYNGLPVNDLPAWKRQMPLVWQSYALFPFMSVLDNVAFGMRSRKMPKAERNKRAQAWLDRLGIGEMAARSPSTLSGGQAQRVALARALVLEPEVLLLDEPLSALDAHMVVRMQSELAELQRSLGITFIYVTHNQSEAFAMANRVVIMNEGELQQVGHPMDVYRAPRTRFVAEFVGANNIVDGEIVKVGEAAYVVDTPIGKLTSSNPSGLEAQTGQRVHLVVSADMVHVGADHSDESANLIDARLVGESFVGNVVTLVFETNGNYELKVQLQQRALSDLDLNINDTATLAFGHDDALLIPSS